MSTTFKISVALALWTGCQAREDMPGREELMNRLKIQAAMHGLKFNLVEGQWRMETDEFDPFLDSLDLEEKH